MFFYPALYKTIAKTVESVTGRGEWFFAQHAPKEMQAVVRGYAGRYRFAVDTTYPIETCIWLFGKYDNMMMRFLRAHVRPGEVFVDIGANCGAFTLAAAGLMQEQGHIYAFEPGPPILARLRTNISLNPSLKSFITVAPVGLGKEPGQFFYKEEAHNRGNASLLNTEGTPVQVVKFDDWATEHKVERLDVVKIDVEGMEYDVLLGMHDSLEKWHPVIYFETLDELQGSSGRSIKATYEYLVSLGYKIVSGEDESQLVDLNGPYPRNSIAIVE